MYYPIPGFNGRYEIDLKGNVWDTQQRYHVPAYDNFCKGMNYPTVNLYGPSGRRPCLVHRLLYDTFIGIPAGFYVHHINGDTHDNRLSNLRAVSPGEHQRIHSRCQISKDQAFTIHRLHQQPGFRIADIAAFYGIHYDLVCNVLYGKGPVYSQYKQEFLAQQAV